MASFDDLPIEVLERIIANIPRRPFKTNILLLNKSLCYLFMIEQLRYMLTSYPGRINWAKLTTNNDIEKPCPNLQFCNLLDKIHYLTFRMLANVHEEAVIGNINQFTNLQRLVLTSMVMFPSWDIRIILDGLPSGIIDITIIGTTLGRGDGGIHSLTSYASRNAKLKKLKFSGTRFDKNRVTALRRLLRKNSTITHLCLIYCGIDDEGARTLAKGLKKNTALVNLSFHSNNIGPEGARALAESLKDNTTLTNLNLEWNDIYANEVDFITEPLKQKTNLTVKFSANI